MPSCANHDRLHFSEAPGHRLSIDDGDRFQYYQLIATRHRRLRHAMRLLLP
jgi:hypothetical protein